MILLRTKPFTKTLPLASPSWFLIVRSHPWIAYLLTGLLAFAASALVTAFAGIPQPHIHDEFSYLLAADTFSHGRLANPVHPLWRHFETFHVLQLPSYASKYPPAQGLILAGGQVIFGHPIVGVWLSAGLACAGICWMLAGWLPIRWAVVGGLVAVVEIVFSGPFLVYAPELFAYWSQSYWGGNVAVLGGALVFGALPRIMKKIRLRDSTWLAVGLAILANGRPFEGLVASIPTAVILGIWFIRTKGENRILALSKVILPVVLVLILTAGWMGFYNYRVTGYPFCMPYQVHESTYGIVPAFLWQPLRPEPHFNHQIMCEFQRCYVSEYLRQESFQGWLQAAFEKIIFLGTFYFGILLTPPIFLLMSSPRSWRRRNILFPLSVCGLVLAALLTETWFWPHYGAPVACLVFLLIVESLRMTRRFVWQGKQWGKFYLACILPLLLISNIILFALAHALQGQSAWYKDRAQILLELKQSPARHLIIVTILPRSLPA